jgi:hypothetical protein
VEPAVSLARRGRLDYLCCDCLAERTLAQAQLRRRADPSAGYDLRLERLVREVVTACLEEGTRVVANMGAANPTSAGERTVALLREAGAHGARVAVVGGDDVAALLAAACLEGPSGGPLELPEGEVVSATAYLGAAPVVEALEKGADVVVTGRVADASLFLAPLLYAHAWSPEDWDRVAAGLLVGHLLECGTYLTGGNWHDPPRRVVPRLADLSFPFADVEADGSAVLSKLEGSGGVLSVETCKAQLLYEVGDPRRYLAPDAVLDMSEVRLEGAGEGRVVVRGARGAPPVSTLKVLVGVLEGWLGEGEASFGGLGALERARASADLVRLRAEAEGIASEDLRAEVIGVDALFGPAAPPLACEPVDVRLRVALRSRDREAVERALAAVDHLYMHGPAGAGGVRRSIRPILGMTEARVRRDLVSTQVDLEVV